MEKITFFNLCIIILLGPQSYLKNLEFFFIFSRIKKNLEIFGQIWGQKDIPIEES